MKKHIVSLAGAVFTALLLLGFTLEIGAAAQGKVTPPQYGKRNNLNPVTKGVNLPGNPSTSTTTFTVDTNSDTTDNHIGDCTCSTANGKCSLRAAIQEANACTGGQTIVFSQALTITPVKSLPVLTDNGTIIDASSQSVTANDVDIPGVILDGNNCIDNGLIIHGNDNVIRGLTILHFKHNGLLLENGAQRNTITENVISANGKHGVYIHESNTSENTITQNKVGTNPIGNGAAFAGITSWGNGEHGIYVRDGDNNHVTKNLASNNGLSGIGFEITNKSKALENQIGVDKDGNALGNASFGIYVGEATKDLEIVSNTIANSKHGVYITTATRVTLEHNKIYSNTTLTENGGGIFVNDTASTVIRFNNIISNTAVSGGGIAIEGHSNASVYTNTIQGNSAINNSDSSLHGGGGVYARHANAAWTIGNTIISNTVYGKPLNYPNSRGGGVFYVMVQSGIINENKIRGNSVYGNAGGGGGVSAIWSKYLYIGLNKIEKNSTETVSFDGSGIDFIHNNDQVAATIANNWLSGNSGGKGTIYSLVSKNTNIVNNIITENPDAGIYTFSSLATITITNNTIVQNDADGIVLNDADLALVNNIVASNAGYGVHLANASDEPVLLSNNDVWGNTSGSSNKTSLSFFLSKDPQFVDPDNGNYQLMPDSPCIDSGSSEHAPKNDYAMVKRPQGDGVDIGAYESIATHYLYLPLVERH